MRTLLLLVLSVLAAGCVPPEDDPTTVKDLRVLGMSLEPPEVMLAGCDASLLMSLAQTVDGGVPTLDPKLVLKLVQASAQSLDFRALIGDPAGQGRDLEYHVRACISTGDRACTNAGEAVELAHGSTRGGELSLAVKPAQATLDDGTPLMFAALNQDTYKGLGGIRVPVVIELASPDGKEHVYAQKLMVYSCQIFPERTANSTPRLPGILWEGAPWPEGEVKERAGKAGVALEPMDFSSLQESYVVPSVSLERVELVESWKVSWVTSSGTMKAYSTGGTDFSGETGRQLNTWVPNSAATSPVDLTLYFVVRDGRGGESWITRQVHWTP